MTRGCEEDTVLAFFQIGRLLQLRLQFHHERMCGILVDGLVTSREERRRQRIEVETERASLRSQIHFKARRVQNFERMQSLGEKEASFVAAGIDGAMKTGNGDHRFARKSLRHDPLLW